MKDSQIVNEQKLKPTNAIENNNRTDTKNLHEIITNIVSRSVKPANINFKYDGKAFTGYIEFSILLDALGLTSNDILDIKNMLFFKQFVIRFIGEYILRNNISMFINSLLEEKINLGNCKSVVDSIHAKSVTTFGIQLNKPKTEIIYTFHIKILEEILGDDFRI